MDHQNINFVILMVIYLKHKIVFRAFFGYHEIFIENFDLVYSLSGHPFRSKLNMLPSLEKGRYQTHNMHSNFVIRGLE